MKIYNGRRKCVYKDKINNTIKIKSYNLLNSTFIYLSIIEVDSLKVIGVLKEKLYFLNCDVKKYL